MNSLLFQKVEIRQNCGFLTLLCKLNNFQWVLDLKKPARTGEKKHLPVTWTSWYERWNLPAYKALVQHIRNTRESVSWKSRVSAILKKYPWTSLRWGVLHSIHSKAAGVWGSDLCPSHGGAQLSPFSAWQCPYWHLTLTLILLLLPALACASCHSADLKQRLTRSQSTANGTDLADRWGLLCTPTKEDGEAHSIAKSHLLLSSAQCLTALHGSTKEVALVSQQAALPALVQQRKMGGRICHLKGGSSCLLSTMHHGNPFSKKGVIKTPSHARKKEEKSLRVSWWLEAGHKVSPGPPAARLPGKEPEGEGTVLYSLLPHHTMQVSGATPGLYGPHLTAAKANQRKKCK